MAKRVTETKLQKYYPWLLTIGGLIGLAAAFVLMVEKIEVLKNPSYTPTCNINPVIACGSVISTDQASAFAFPNPILGLIGFAAVVVVGVTLLANRKFTNRAWYWKSFWAGTLFGVGFIHWLAFQSIYNIGALCPYCMVVWAVTMPIFWYTTLWNLREGYLKLPKGWGKFGDFLQRNHFGILLSWYLIIAGLILNRFWYFFGF